MICTDVGLISENMEIYDDVRIWRAGTIARLFPLLFGFILKSCEVERGGDVPPETVAKAFLRLAFTPT